MSLKQNILEEFDEKFPKTIAHPQEFEDWLCAEKNDIKGFILSKLSLIEQEVRKCVPESKSFSDKDLEEVMSSGTLSNIFEPGEMVGHNSCRQQVLDNLDKLFNE